MRYKKYMNEINSKMNEFTNGIDLLGTKYTVEKNKIAEMRNENKYTDAYINEYAKTHDTSDQTRQLYNNWVDKYTPSIEYLLSKIKADLDSFFCGDVRPDYVQKLTGYKITGVTLTNREIEILYNQARSYPELRMLHQIATDRTRKEKVVSIDENGKPYNEIIDKHIIDLGLFDIPDMEKTYSAFNEYKNQVMKTLNGYSGSKGELIPILKDKPVFAIVDSENSYIKTKSCENFEKEVSNATKCLPENKIKRVLTEKDKELIDSLIDPRYPSLFAGEVAKYSRLNDELAEIISLDERFTNFIPTNE